MAVQHNQVRKRLRMEMLAPEETGIMSLQREVMELKQENKRLRRDICKGEMFVNLKIKFWTLEAQLENWLHDIVYL